MSAPSYDAWKLSASDSYAIGTDEGDTCGRYPEPDGDAPRGYRPKPCAGTMGFAPVANCSCHTSPPCGACVGNPMICDECGEEA